MKWLWLSLGIFAALPTQALELAPEPQFDDLVESVVKVTKRRHFVEVQFDDALAKQVFEKYLESLDPTHSNFTLEDIQNLRRWETLLDDQLLRGQQTAAFAIYNRYLERSTARLNYYLAQLESADQIDLNKPGRLEADPEKRGYAANETELRSLWDSQVRNQLLNLVLADQSIEAAADRLERRFKAQLNRQEQTRPLDVVSTFLNAYTLSFDPHTTYYSPRQAENFDINMSLQLQGIGAVLQTEDEMTRVVNLIPGGPAERAGELQAADRILGVAQDQEDMVDVVGWRLDEVVQLIRGPQGSTVRLEILPAGAAVGSASKVITIVRDTVQLEDQSAQGEVLELDGRTLGVITVPTFYTDFAARQRGEKDYRSTTRDVARIIQELTAQNIEGLILDLRDNGGGALQEANSLTGLFIPTGPVVQIRGTGNRQQVLADQNPEVQYAGPLVVLVNRGSASASEILAGAIQDYNRGIIVGNQTFGKGTVQAVLPLGSGQIKLTQAKFYRISGDSTQNRGVLPDISLPWSVDPEIVGESVLDQALPYDEISPAPYRVYPSLGEFIAPLDQKHLERTEADPNFTWWREYFSALDTQAEDTELRLGLAERKQHQENRRLALLNLENQRRTALGLDPIEEFSRADGEELMLKSGLEETGRILLDWIDLQADQLAKAS